MNSTLTSATSPHKAILDVRVEVHPLMESGECSGKPIKLSEHPEYSLKSNFLLTVDGFDLHDCLVKLRNKLNDFAKK